MIVAGDPNGDPPPLLDRGQLVVFGSSSVVIGTVAEPDGEVQVELAEAGEGTSDLPTVATGRLLLKGRTLAVGTIHGEVFLERNIEPGEVRIEVRADDESEPNRIYIEFCQAG